ncbi:DUF3006 domain-containing protein [Clostridium tarantellae]|uniref:DUF3006 family protein n=1 Tax=Clostridium tarantellae TaxID=39493 RepID=A0A6I1MIT6_9CLOT|nr:DUF3006 domain-containing protein [Clostridium tarantellae]MPQ42603.1 DUF3006 family protein [Clostridium tarantellae]
MNEIIVDRIENGVITCEDSNCKIIYLTSSQVKGVVKEGDVLIECMHNTYCVDNVLTKKRKEQINKLMEDMWED